MYQYNWQVFFFLLMVHKVIVNLKFNDILDAMKYNISKD